MTPGEMPKLLMAINAESNIYIRASFWLYLFTGLRRNELLSLKRDQIDWHNRQLNIPDTKSDEPHIVPLSSAAMTLLSQIPALAGNKYLLPGARKGEHLVEIKKAWARIRTAAGCPDLHVHDLRRTTGSWLVQNGSSLPLIGKILNHKHPATTQMYAIFDNGAGRTVLEEHGQRIMNAAQGEQASVISIRKAAS